MSSIIDEVMFQSPFPSLPNHQEASEELLSSMFKSIRISQESILQTKGQNVAESLTKLKPHHQEFLLKLTSSRDNYSIRSTACLLEGSEYWRTSSKHQDILLMKELVKRQKECSPEANIYMERGRVLLVMDHFLVVPQLAEARWTTAYHRIIMRNVLHLQLFLHRFLKIGRGRRRRESECEEGNYNLLLSRILNTTETMQEISEERCEFTSATHSLQRQSEQLAGIERGISCSAALQASVKALFVHLPQFIQSSGLKQKFVSVFQSSSKSLRTLLTVKYLPKRRIQDYLFNMVKLELLEPLANGRPIAEGGTSLVYAYRANLTFVSSADHEYEARNQEKVERMVAIKKPRFESEGRRDKIIHEKKIVEKFRSSVCYFLPKYYEVQKQPELSNCLLMEMLSGEELDFYVAVRSESISLWSKIYILLNVIYGMRHLAASNIVHLDLKPINVLVCKSLVAKIIDFGEAYHPDVCPKNYTPGFTFPYVAPEVYIRFLKQSFKREDHLQYSQKQDVFALGIIMSEIFFNSRIFNLSKAKFMEVYTKREHLQRFFYAVERNQSYGDDLFISMIGFLIVRCLDPDPQRRPRVEWIGIALKLMLNSFHNI